jgi:peptide deformylase
MDKLMDSYQVIQLGNPLLRVISEPISSDSFGTAELNDIETLLFDILAREDGLGLAAPQIGINKRVMVFGLPDQEAANIPYTILFNPSFEPLTDIMEEHYEACLSVRELRGKVPRYKSIGYRGYDAEGNLIEREVSDLHARVFQHELDHLNGVIFLDKVRDYSSLGFHDELIKSGAFPSSNN